MSGEQIEWRSGDAFSNAEQANGSTLSSAAENPFEFQLGTFDVDVLAYNANTWVNGFINAMNSSNIWTTQFNAFAGSGSTTGDSSDEEQAYIFGFNTLDSTEIILFTNEDWTFPIHTGGTDPNPSASFSLENDGTQVLGANGEFSDLGDNFQMFLVPEPSTYAALAGMFVICTAMLRRRT